MSINYTKGIILVCGPVKSGKSRFAESLLHNKKNVIYIATNNISDNSKQWRERILNHQERRPKHWQLIESPKLSYIFKNIKLESNIIIDSIGGIVLHHLDQDDISWQSTMTDILNIFKTFKGLIILVGEEVGWGVSPPTSVGNLFRDRLGQFTENINNISTDSWLALHGRAINIRKNSLKI